MATVRPAAVVISASDIPPAKAFALPVPCNIISLNTLIMPTTVPSKPIKGVIAAMVPNVLRYRSMLWTTCAAACSILSTIVSRPYWELTNPAASICPSGDDNRSSFSLIESS